MRAWSALALLMVFLLSACVAPLCVTRCGLTVNELPKDWSCDDVQGREEAALWAFKATKDPRLTTCNLTRFHLMTVDAGSWWSFGKMVAGLTYCDNGAIVIGNRPPFESALPHELAHALQNCEPLPPYNDTEGFHSNWERDGIYYAIEKSKTYGDAGP